MITCLILLHAVFFILFEYNSIFVRLSGRDGHDLVCVECAVVIDLLCRMVCALVWIGALCRGTAE